MMKFFWRSLICLAFLLPLPSAAQDALGESGLEGDNPAIYLADGFDMPVGSETERRDSNLWASAWDSRWQFGMPENETYRAGIELFIAGSEDQPIFAPASGLVIFSEAVFPFGTVLLIRHDPLFRSDGLVIYSRLSGLSASLVEAGSRVRRGELLGESPSQLEFALSSSAILEEFPLFQPESLADLAHFLNPYEFIAAYRPREAQQESLFALPVAGTISQGYSERHPGIDIDAPEGSPILASAEGLVIRRMDCRDCRRIFPCRRPQYRDENRGFGYGNFLILRYEAVFMPPELREVMAAYDYRYAYVLYGHLSEMDVDYGAMLDSGELFARVGTSACVSAASLHLELRIGNDESVDGRWQRQVALDPLILFEGD